MSVKWAHRVRRSLYERPQSPSSTSASLSQYFSGDAVCNVCRFRCPSSKHLRPGSKRNSSSERSACGGYTIFELLGEWGMGCRCEFVARTARRSLGVPASAGLRISSTVAKPICNPSCDSRNRWLRRTGRPVMQSTHRKTHGNRWICYLNSAIRIRRMLRNLRLE